MDWQHAAALLLGYLGQWLKSFKNIPTAATQVALASVAIFLFALQTPPTQPLTSWVMQAITWAFAVVGVASVSAATRIAPKTDSQ
ncbi:MAG: hypothetical protein EBT79_06005 [Actinobacteria bacterium]|nr:hypothetical protein [Actinomycetota bacterium]